MKLFSTNSQKILYLIIRLYQGDISSAVSLYRQAGTKHFKTALKLAASGNIAELLSFLQAVFNSQNIDISHVERVHLSNLSLMCQYHQLCSASLLSKYYFEEKLLYFLKTNRWYDASLGVRQSVESSSWKLITGINCSKHCIALYQEQMFWHLLSTLDS